VARPAVQFDFKPDLPLPPVDNPFERVWNSSIAFADVDGDDDPEITSDNTKEVAENAAAVLKVTAEDADAGTTIAYPLSSLLA